ncbi:MAG TPA: cytochrome c [Terriglobales bacterium]|nr:cytochrome c [Terriglobales bacterium]
MRRVLFVLSLAALAAIAGCKVSGPGNLESAVAREVKQKITIGGKDWKNPTPDTPESVKQGAEHFQHHCMICHGLDGHATGVPFAMKMDPPVPDLASKDVQAYSDGQLKWIVQNGIGPSGMPAWNGILDENEMWLVVRYIRNLPPAGSLGAPAIYKEVEEEHEHEHGKGVATPKGKASGGGEHQHEHKH